MQILSVPAIIHMRKKCTLCDREGIVIIDEVPAVGIGAGAGINPYETFPIREHHEQSLRT